MDCGSKLVHLERTHTLGKHKTVVWQIGKISMLTNWQQKKYMFSFFTYLLQLVVSLILYKGAYNCHIMPHMICATQGQALPPLLLWSWLGAFRGDCLPYINPVTSATFNSKEIKWACVRRSWRMSVGVEGAMSTVLHNRLHANASQFSRHVLCRSCATYSGPEGDGSQQHRSENTWCNLAVRMATCNPSVMDFCQI